MKFTEEKLLFLRKSIEDGSAGFSEKRKIHTLAVEEMAIRLAALYCPEKTDVLRAAALLHDVTKEYPYEQQIEILKEHGCELTDADCFAPKTLHARTAACLIPELYPEFADSEVISAVRWHTTGRKAMTLTEKLLYLADYIDESRRFPDCVKLRNAFFDAGPEKMEISERLVHLREILIMSYDMTVTALIADESPISPDTVLALNELICSKKLENNDKNI